MSSERLPTWLVLHSGAGGSAHNMAMDEALLHAAPDLGMPVLRFYSWAEPAATFGYFQKYADVEQATLLRPLIRRPTGGGIVPHDADWTYSLVFPPNDAWYHLRATESYQRVHEWIQAALLRVGVATELAPSARKTAPGQCFAGWEQSDVLWHGRKIAGAAQRRTRDGLLVQGSLQPPPVRLNRADWEQAMCEVARLEEGVEWEPFESPAGFEQRVAALVQGTYARAAYNHRR